VLCSTKIDGKIRGERLYFFSECLLLGCEKITCYDVPSAYATKFQRGF
jgi:hypothetical protein